MISLKNVSLRRGTKVLLEDASITLNPGEKVGLIGRNGAGKSSLFALLNGGLIGLGHVLCHLGHAPMRRHAEFTTVFE
ncbi:MAG: ATP-binding cassette domain-containing protein, partial [Limnohabitans sp.]